MTNRKNVFKDKFLYSTLTDLSHERFSIGHIREELVEHGYCVVSHVVPIKTCDGYVQQIRDWLATFGDEFPKNGNSLVHSYNVSHLEPLWQARLQTKGLFSALWNTDKLLTSMDTMAVGRPPEEGQEVFGDIVPKKGLHLDQSKRRQGLHAYQGALYLEESLSDDWCLVVAENSHKLFEDFFKHFCDLMEEDYLRLSPCQIDWFIGRGCTIRRVPVPKGGMVLWDSRTVHAGAPPVEGRRTPGRWRHVCFICQTPAVWSTSQDLDLLRDAYENMRITFHWPSQGVQTFKYDQTKYDVTTLPDVAKSEEVQRLVGLLPYDFNDGRPNGTSWEPKWKHP